MPSIRPRPAASVARLCLSLFVLSCALAALPSAAAAGTPATVTVRVEDFGHTVLPQTTVTTSNASVLPDQVDSCSGTSAGGALWDATGGQWQGLYNQGYQTYEVDSISGVGFPANFAGDAYWSLFVNGTFAQSGLCGQELQPGDDVVFFAQCQGLGSDCTSSTAPDHFLTESNPSVTTVQAGGSVSVTVGSVGTSTGAPESLPGGVVVSAGAISAAPNAQGVATLTFPAAGTYTLQAGAPDSVPSDPHTVTVVSAAPASASPAVSTTTTTSTTATTTATAGVLAAPATHTGPAVFAVAGGVLNSHVYPAGRGPRTLSGTVSAVGALADVRLRLTRDDGGRCSYYDGLTERFLASPCGVNHGRFFSIGKEASFTYLLPARLARGRYVLDVQAVDSAGHVSALYHGTSRMVFYVR